MQGMYIIQENIIKKHDIYYVNNHVNRYDKSIIFMLKFCYDKSKDMLYMELLNTASVL